MKTRQQCCTLVDSKSSVGDLSSELILLPHKSSIDIQISTRKDPKCVAQSPENVTVTKWLRQVSQQPFPHWVERKTQKLKRQWRCQWFNRQTDLTSAMSLSNCAILGKTINLSDLWFPQTKIEPIMTTLGEFLCV
jgi:hypothetical protein